MVFVKFQTVKNILITNVSSVLQGIISLEEVVKQFPVIALISLVKYAILVRKDTFWVKMVSVPYRNLVAANTLKVFARNVNLLLS